MPRAKKPLNKDQILAKCQAILTDETQHARDRLRAAAILLENNTNLIADVEVRQKMEQMKDMFLTSK